MRASPPVYSVSLPLVGLIVVLSAMLGLTTAPALAAWTPATVHRSSDTVRMAQVGHTFASTTGVGTGGQSYEAVKIIGFPSVDYVELKNTSTVPVTLSGSIELLTFLLGTTVNISRCSVAWVGASSPGTTHTYVSAVLNARMNVSWISTAIDPGHTLQLRVAIGGTIANKVTLTAVPAVARVAGNLTWL